jgi:hypothetical protein
VIPGGPVRPVCPRSPFSPFAHAVSAKGARKARTAIETRIQVLHSPPTEAREGAFSCIIFWHGARIGGALVETAFTWNGEFVVRSGSMFAYMEAG